MKKKIRYFKKKATSFSNYYWYYRIHPTGAIYARRSYPTDNWEIIVDPVQNRFYKGNFLNMICTTCQELSEKEIFIELL